MAQKQLNIDQNIFDLAMELYGSIEGIFDLFISNSELSYNTDLSTLKTLDYHDFFYTNNDVLQGFKTLNVTPCNSYGHCYYHELGKPIAILAVDDNAVYSSISIAGDGEMVIDWGDNSTPQKIVLKVDSQDITHYFDDESANRRIRIYGPANFTLLDISKSFSILFPIVPMVVEQYIHHGNIGMIDGIALFDGLTYKIDLSSSRIETLAPIYDIELQELNLSNCTFIGEALSDYLTYKAEHYSENQRGCTITLSSEPNARGMEAINSILLSSSGGTNEPWTFIINGKIYSNE